MKNLLAGEQQAAVTVAVEGLMEARPVPELDAFATFDPRVRFTERRQAAASNHQLHLWTGEPLAKAIRSEMYNRAPGQDVPHYSLRFAPCRQCLVESGGDVQVAPWRRPK